MNEAKASKRTFSQESRERMQAAALARHDARAERAHARVRVVMAAIQTEMADNNGIYPNNKGAVSLAEVARRAEIHQFTFHKPRYQELRQEVKDWLAALKSGTVVGRGRVRKELGTRVQEWKELYEGLLETYRMAEADLEHAKARLEDVIKENEKLQKRLSKSKSLKVVPLLNKTEH